MSEVRMPSTVNPLDQETIDRMRREKEEVEQRLAAERGSLVETADLSETGQTIAGFRCRPMSAGLLAILEISGSPFFREDESGKAEKEVSLSDCLVLMFLLLSDVEEDDLIDLADAGYKAMRRAAIKWGNRLDVQSMREIQAEIPTVISGLERTMNLYVPSPDESDKKK